MADDDDDIDDASEDDLEQEIYDTKVSISTPIDDDVDFVVSKIKAFEAISKPFIIEIFMHADAQDIQDFEDDIFESFIGEECSVSIDFYTSLDDGSNPQTKYFHGIAGEFSYIGEKRIHDEIRAQYKLTLYPQFWALKHQKDFRIFQGQTSLEIIEDVFLSDIDHEILVDDDDEGIEQRDYCVQYGETTFDFLSRLMEEDGIFYYFDHQEDGHTMNFGNDNSHFEDLSSLGIDDEDESDDYDEDEESDIFTLKTVESFSGTPYFNTLTKAEFKKQMSVEKYVSMEFDFKQPSESLIAETSDEDDEDVEQFMYEYPGRYTTLTLGDAIAQRRIEGAKIQEDIFTGESTSPFLKPGYVFMLQGPDIESWDEDWDTNYNINTIYHTFDFTNDKIVYSNKFTAFESDTPFRPQRATTRPRVYGAETAIVMGPEDEEIYTDTYGRIKVKFHWDHDEDEELTDDTRTCWIRVAQSFAGSGFGALFTPRIGQEVLVTFINGNPDRPIVTGALYNEDNMPPYRDEDDLQPEVSTIKTQSTPDSEGFNEIRFDDTAGEEELYFHAEKDMNIDVLGDQNITISGDKNETIEGDYNLTVDGDMNATIAGDLNITVDGNLIVIIEQGATINVAALLAITTGAGINIQTSGYISAKAALTISLSSLLGCSMYGLTSASVSSTYGVTVTAGTAVAITASAAVAITAGAAVTIKATANVDINSGIAVTVVAVGAVSINAGGAVDVAAGLTTKIAAVGSCTVSGLICSISGTTATSITGGTCSIKAATTATMAGNITTVSGTLIASVKGLTAISQGKVLVQAKALLAKINC